MRQNWPLAPALSRMYIPLTREITPNQIGPNSNGFGLGMMVQPFEPTSPPSRSIAGSLTVQDWIVRRSALLSGATQDDWGKAFDDFLCQRLHLRYLNPISTIRDSDTFNGEGFTIVAIQCTLIEFLAATVEGKSYKWRGNGQFEYPDSRKIFCDFLVTQDPFKSEFDAPTSEDFYTGVRCGLLHEARTKKGWSILAEDSVKIIDAGRKIVFRNNLHSAIAEFLKIFRSRLADDAAAQAAFIRKFDSLCQE